MKPTTKRVCSLFVNTSIYERQESLTTVGNNTMLREHIITEAVGHYCIFSNRTALSGVALSNHCTESNIIAYPGILILLLRMSILIVCLQQYLCLLRVKNII